MATGQTLSFQQIEDLWTANGGSAGWAPLMAAIAEAESGGNTAALNNTPATGDYSVGLWQINYYNGLLASRTNSYGSPAALQADPNLQAKAAISLFANGAGASNWQGDAAWKTWQAHGAPSQPSAATLAGWGIGGGGGGGPTTSQTATGGPAAGGASGVGSNDLSTCVVQMPGFLFFSGPCLLTKGGVKWLSGVAALGLGAGLLGFGVVLLAAWGFDASGAKEATGKVARTVGVPAALFAGQPEVAAGLKMTGGGGRQGSRARTQRIGRSSSSSTQQTGRRQATGERVAGRRESRRIEDRYRRTVAQQGPIGPRGANAASRRAYERRTSYPGAGRPRTPEQRARARQRASEPF